ncbi:type 1 glutamine amidotransferase family protein [Xanthocytophaga agilis]|uniref:Type 1 glutamine amidotransferase family protein n=1 Tax=Xanthocytophaga agilis TaxID=3048010 RepID=A0AAE3R2L6_9BACT|nr:type 1 glutamine amidotransferase family protein [Xanthocytophaga agilis]MDJ1500185.1 type 1 glutamine amidotransferase family protein [Xanthocytophaga agilis]
MKQIIYLFVFEGFADWEPSYATAEIQKSSRYQIRTVGLTSDPIRSMGGLTILPDYTIEEVETGSAAMLILPGGEAWEQKKLTDIQSLVLQFHKSNLPIAAICAATTFLGDIGLLNAISHTSNAKFYLESISANYKGQNYYAEEPAVTDQRIITANGISPIEFAREIFRILGIYDEQKLEQWYQVFKYGVWTE